MLLFIVFIASSSFGQEKREKTKHNKLQFNGYGEILYRSFDFGANPLASTKGSIKENRAIIDIPRFILGMDYDFGSGFTLSTEIEYEHGGTGSTIEYEYDEMGEYETEVEKGGEVVIEQFHLTKRFSSALSVRAGHIILGFGQINQHHLPTEYFTSVRPEAESSILPSTWHETGIEIFGQLNDWRYRFQLVNGLDANAYSSREWIKPGRQTKFELINATSMAYLARLEYAGINGLVLSSSYYYGPKTCKNVQKPSIMKGIDGDVSLFSLTGRYNNRGFISRFDFMTGKLSDSGEITARNRRLSKHAQYSRTPVAAGAIAYGIELGYDVLRFVDNSKSKLYPFFRYDFYNSMDKVQGGVFADARLEKTVYTLGINWMMHKSIALKADYSMRKIDGGNYNDENTFGLALVFNTVYR